MVLTTNRRELAAPGYSETVVSLFGWPAAEWVRPSATTAKTNWLTNACGPVPKAFDDDHDIVRCKPAEYLNSVPPAHPETYIFTLSALIVSPSRVPEMVTLWPA